MHLLSEHPDHFETSGHDGTENTQEEQGNLNTSVNYHKCKDYNNEFITEVGSKVNSDGVLESKTTFHRKKAARKVQETRVTVLMVSTSTLSHVKKMSDKKLAAQSFMI